jgi:hypothetical protein
VTSEGAFARGALTGVAASAVLVQIWLAVELAPMRAMYDQFTGSLPALTSLVISPYWLWGAPGAGAIAVALLARRRPPGLVIYLLTALALVLVVAATWRFANAPLHELADAIR